MWLHFTWPNDFGFLLCEWTMFDKFVCNKHRTLHTHVIRPIVLFRRRQLPSAFKLIIILRFRRSPARICHFSMTTKCNGKSIPVHFVKIQLNGRPHPDLFHVRRLSVPHSRFGRRIIHIAGDEINTIILSFELNAWNEKTNMKIVQKAERNEVEIKK